MKDSRALSMLDKLGAVGVLLAAAAPCCFPLLATVGATLGLGALQSWRGYMDYAIQGFALTSAVGGVFAYRQRRLAWPLAFVLVSVAVVFFAFIAYHVALIYAGLAGLGASAAWNSFIRRRGWFTLPRPRANKN